ncbi:MAG TPA: four helix bundle protein [Bacteroidota bacterium]|jgi:four helix bundle protein|nr:four helix bundle protein [Bacteroidota bacterium]
MHKFKDLIVYQKALKFTRLVRQSTKGFPKEELFILTSQFRRAADSMVLNIAEGAGNRSKKEFCKFLDYSIRSAFECAGCLDIALENEMISEEMHSKIMCSVNELIAMLDGLQKSLSR